MRLNSRVPARDRVVVVTGAGSGIGRAVALRFARNGDRVVVTDVDRNAAKETGRLIHREGGIAIVDRLDVTKPADWERLAAQVAADHGGADIVINNAGILVMGSFLDHSVADWKRTVDVNVYGVAHGSRVFGQQMVDRGRGGQIVNLASAAAWAVSPLEGPYSVSKAAVLMLSEGMRMELGPQGVGVSAICPGVVRTPLSSNASAAALSSDEFSKTVATTGAIQERLPFTSPDTVARAIELAVRFDLAIVPVGPEAFALYGLRRLSPGLLRELTGRFATAGALDTLAGVVERLVPGVAAHATDDMPAVATAEPAGVA